MEAKKTAACCALIAIAIKRKKQRRRNRTIWTRDWIVNRRNRGAYHQLLQELRLTDLTSYHHFLRMDIASFEEILEVVSPLIKRQDTVMRQAIPPGERLALTLRFLATGISIYNYILKSYIH